MATDHVEDSCPHCDGGELWWSDAAMAWECDHCGHLVTDDDSDEDDLDSADDCDFCGGSGVDDNAVDYGTEDYDVCPHCGGLG